MQLKALDMRKGREFRGGDKGGDIQEVSEERKRERERVRSLSPVQTFTSYETVGELPVLGTGCR